MKRFILLFSTGVFLYFVEQPFEPYDQAIKNSKEKISMIPVQGGEFVIGSPAMEAGRNEDEGPQKKIKISPFWMSKYEITWDTYLVFQNRELETAGQTKVDAIARPTKPYVEMSFGQGKNGGFPVCNVTQYAARAYCKWLYQTTGVFYRLPTEAEWEYAARAGSTSPYYFGDDSKVLGDYAWYFENSDGAYKKVGLKKPNQWGFYDMYGNVSEWTSDQYFAESYGKIKDGDVDPYFSPNDLYPHTIRGGSWDDDPQLLRSAARAYSTPKLKQIDPQIPRSNWWMTNAPFLGFRIVRPVKVPDKEEIEKYYELPPKDI